VASRAVKLLFLTLLALPCLAQRGVTPAPASPRSIAGQVRMDSQPAPQGVLVLLDIAAGMGEAPAGAGQASRTVTEAGGKFSFEQLELVGRQGKELFAVTARYPGYKDAVQIVDLRTTHRAGVVLEMHRDNSRDIPNVPPGGPTETVSARKPGPPEAQSAWAHGEEQLLQRHDPRASIADFKKVLKLDPQYAPGYLMLGTAYMQTQEYVDAQEAFEKLIKIEPGNAAAFLGVGASLNQRGDFSGALKPLQHSLELNPNSAEANYELGRSLWALGKWQEAEPHVRKSIELNRDFAMSHVLMGNIYLRLRNADSALTEFQEYLRLDPAGPHSAAVKDMVAKIQKALGTR
jgi:tetratricopeptide (TPR) repeat protein